MNKTGLKKLSKSQLINLLLKQQQPKYIVNDMKPKRRPILTPKRSVKQLAQDYENIIEPPVEFRNPVPTPIEKSVKTVVENYEQNIIAPIVQFRDE